MAKLEELATPTELLDAIRDGALKRELVKKYRTSDQELAKFLLPLYRNGKLTKEEFNDFFKGVPLRTRAAEGEGVSFEEFSEPATPDLPPSQIFRALSEVVENPSFELLEPVSPASREEAPAAVDILPATDSAPAKDAGKQAATVSEPAAPVPGPQETTGKADSMAVYPADSAEAGSLLNMVFARLNSIDDRLARIEKKISSV
ncbi:MAG: hypothetical protein HY913_00335 [Desulfomonile tiedjei]|nr:hypothetical protein [Desulfomonile tiedjei]